MTDFDAINKSNRNLLILTVGQGMGKDGPERITTALCDTVKIMRPRRFWLLPSVSDISNKVADNVAKNEEIRELFAEICEPIEDPFRLEACRQACRKAINRVKQSLKADEKLVINPTTGTKQMSAGAVIAALDEGIGNIAFTEGNRGSQGIVESGTEEMLEFRSGAYFRERDIKQAEEFFIAGDFYAAREVLEQYKDAEKRLYSLVSTCHYWSRFDYDNAILKCGDYSEELKQYLESCNNDKNFNLKSICDILGWANYALHNKDADQAMLLTQKALEGATLLFLRRDCAVEKTEKSGFFKLWARLERYRHPFYRKAGGYKMLKFVEERNRMTHKMHAAGLNKATQFNDLLKTALAKTEPSIRPTKLPTELADFQACITPTQS